MTTASALNRQAATRAITGWLIRCLVGVLAIAAIVFLSAGRLDWPGAWVYLAVYAVAGLLPALFMDPEMLAERTARARAGQKPWDKALFGFYGLLITLIVPLVAGLNLRFGWPPEVALRVQGAALAFYVAGWAIHLWAMASNRFFAAVVRIQRERGQTVATGGPYRFVRHPGYAGGVLLTAAGPLVLGSAWALIPGVLGALLLLVRTALEDRMLQAELEGYADYAARVRYRLAPGLW